MSDVEQYLDLIAENAQIKAEIQSLSEYSNSVRLFDRKILKVCADQALGKDNNPPQFAQIISTIKLGIPPVESAESFKKIMMAERNSKISEKQNAQIIMINQLKEKLQNKLDITQGYIHELETKIEEHNHSINESEAIQTNFQNQINAIRQSIEASKLKTAALTDEVTKAQAYGLKLNRIIDKAQGDLTHSIKNGSIDQDHIDPIIQIVKKLKKHVNNSNSTNVDI